LQQHVGPLDINDRDSLGQPGNQLCAGSWHQPIVRAANVEDRNGYLPQLFGYIDHRNFAQPHAENMRCYSCRCGPDGLPQSCISKLPADEEAVGPLRRGVHRHQRNARAKPPERSAWTGDE